VPVLPSCKLLQLLRFGCSYEAIADTTCSATMIRNRRDEWIRLGVFAKFKQIALESYDRIVGLILDQIAVDGAITKAPGGGEVAGRSPVDRGKQGLKRSGMTDGYGIPLGRILAGANRHDSPLLAPTLDRLHDLGPLPQDITVHLDAGYDSEATRALLAERDLHGRIAHRGEKAPIQASQRWHVERTHAWQNAFHRLAHCNERRATVIDTFFDLADTIITVRSLIRRAWTTYRWNERPSRRP
jgi:transposase